VTEKVSRVCHYACGYTQKRVGSIICEYACQDHAFMLLVTLEYAISRIAMACKIEVGSVGDNILQNPSRNPPGILLLVFLYSRVA
jgi:hypothetical protein